MSTTTRFVSIPINIQYEEPDQEENYNCFSKFQKLKVCQQERKQWIKESQMNKCSQRKSREPGNRLGKNAKKIAGRINFINKSAEMNEAIDSIEPMKYKSPQKTFGRMKRKVGHRQKYIDFEN